MTRPAPVARCESGVASIAMRGTANDDTPSVPTIRTTLLTEIPAPFRIPLFNALAAKPEVELSVLFLSERDPQRPYPVYADEFQFSWRVLPSRELLRGGRWVVFSRRVSHTLRRLRPSIVIIGGWNQPAFWAAAVYARLARIPLVVWVESTARDTRPGSPLTELPKRLLLRSSKAYLVPGRASAEYLEGLGVAASLITTAPNAVDPTIFEKRVDALRLRRPELRAELGIDDAVVLYVGRLEREKGVDLLVEAAQSLSATVVIVGRGSEERALQADAPTNVRFEGWFPRDELARWYAVADVFVLPSRSDQWGMVLNEAAAAGLPLVATEAVGGAHDLIKDGVNGFRVAGDDVPALRAALDRLLEDDRFREAAGVRSRELAAAHTPQAWASAVSELLQRLKGDA